VGINKKKELVKKNEIDNRKIKRLEKSIKEEEREGIVKISFVENGEDIINKNKVKNKIKNKVY
jgi:hypothetical protein